MKKFFPVLLWASFIAVTAISFLYGIDREVARQDYLKGGPVENCLFEDNCVYYQTLLSQN